MVNTTVSSKSRNPSEEPELVMIRGPSIPIADFLQGPNEVAIRVDSNNLQKA